MNTFLSKFIKTAVLLSGIILFGISTTNAQQPDRLLTYRSLFWMDENSGVEVYLLERRAEKNKFNLVVVSDKDIEVVYRTEINSMEPVVKELTPVKTVKDRRYYDVQHSFTKMTIWMALDFKFEGKRIESLTRTFYDNLFEIVPNEQFLKNSKK